MHLVGNTPSEALYGTKPDISSLHLWGSHVWVHNLTAGRLDPRGEKDTLLAVTVRVKVTEPTGPTYDRLELNMTSFLRIAQLPTRSSFSPSWKLIHQLRSCQPLNLLKLKLVIHRLSRKQNLVHQAGL